MENVEHSIELITSNLVYQSTVRMTEENNIALSPLIYWISYSLAPGITVPCIVSYFSRARCLYYLDTIDSQRAA